MENKKGSNKKERRLGASGIFIFLGLVAVALIVGIVLLIIKFKTDSYLAPEFSLPILLVFGLIALLIALTSMVAVFSSLKLTNRDFALGMPQGSVRALIALSLILIFLMSSIFLFGQLKNTTTEEIKNFPENQLDAFKDQIVSIRAREVIIGVETKMVYDVTLVTNINKAGVDFAKQILTTISTLIVAIAAFYFGTRAVSVARGEQVQLLPVISKIEPGDADQGQRPLVTISGRNFISPKEVKLVKGKDEISALEKDITSSTDMIRCTFHIPENAQPEKWDLVVINDDGGKDVQSEAFTVNELPEAGGK